jgi:hypothetical protein
MPKKKIIFPFLLSPFFRTMRRKKHRNRFRIYDYGINFLLLHCNEEQGEWLLLLHINKAFQMPKEKFQEEKKPSFPAVHCNIVHHKKG